MDETIGTYFEELELRMKIYLALAEMSGLEEQKTRLKSVLRSVIAYRKGFANVIVGEQEKRLCSLLTKQQEALEREVEKSLQGHA